MAMKDAAVGETFRGGDEQPLIRKYPNGETPCEESHDLESIFKKQTSGSETSQYREEKKLTQTCSQQVDFGLFAESTS